MSIKISLYQGGNTALHYGARAGHATVVGMLLMGGADMEATNDVRGGGGTRGVDREGLRRKAQRFV